MMSVNKQTLLGYAGKDPIIRFTPDSKTANVASFNLATTESWKDKTSGEYVEETEWHRVVVYGWQAQVVEDRIKKGSRVYVEGKSKTRKWNDKDTGQERTIKEVICDKLIPLDGKSGEDATKEAPAAKPASSTRTNRAAAQPTPQRPTDDDDLPF